jgi:hypothetical protein
MVDYDAKASVSRTWGLSCPIWLLITGLCGFVECAGWFAMNGRVNGWGDIAFYLTFSVVGLVALVNTLRLIQQRRRGPSRRGLLSTKRRRTLMSFDEQNR